MLTTQQRKIARQIWKEIEKAEKILLHFHRNADGDSVSCNVAVASMLKQLGKQVTIANGDQVPVNFYSYVDWKNAEKRPLLEIPMIGFDLHLSLDTAEMGMTTKDENLLTDDFKKIKRINIDHHPTNTLFGDINLVVVDKISCAEVVYELFCEWGIVISKELADSLLLGVVTDSGGFQYQNVTVDTFKTAMDLVADGGDLNRANLVAYKSASFEVMKYWAVILQQMKFDESRKLVWSCVSYESVKQLGEEVLKYEETSNVLLRMVDKTDIGVLIVEKEPGIIGISMRSRTGVVRVDSIAQLLGGGGHQFAAGAKLFGVTLLEAERKLFEVLSEVYPNLGKLTT